MKTITIGKQTFTILFPDLVRPLNPDEREALKRSIQENGVRVPVATDGDDGVIDGINRLVIAAELGLDNVTIESHLGLSDEQKRELAISLNADRRQLTPEERERLAEERRGRVRVKRDGGMSLRAIAEEENVSLGQVQRDLADSGVSGDTVTGKDGKTYRAKRAKQPEYTEEDIRQAKELLAHWNRSSWEARGKFIGWLYYGPGRAYLPQSEA